MAKIEPLTHLDAIRGKYARTDKVYTRVRVFDNQIIGVALKHPATNLPPSEGQQTAQQKMKAVQAKVSTIMADAAPQMAPKRVQYSCSDCERAVRRLRKTVVKHGLANIAGFCVSCVI